MLIILYKAQRPLVIVFDHLKCTIVQSSIFSNIVYGDFMIIINIVKFPLFMSILTKPNNSVKALCGTLSKF